METERYQLVYKEERKSCEYESLPVEHPEYSLGFAFSRLLGDILLVPEIRLHLLEVHAPNGGERIPSGGRRQMCGSLFLSRGADFGDVLRTVAPMSTSVELTFAAWVLWLSAVLDAVPFFSAVEALVALWWGCLTLSFFLIIP